MLRLRNLTTFAVFSGLVIFCSASFAQSLGLVYTPFVPGSDPLALRIGVKPFGNHVVSRDSKYEIEGCQMQDLGALVDVNTLDALKLDQSLAKDEFFKDLQFYNRLTPMRQIATCDSGMITIKSGGKSWPVDMDKHVSNNGSDVVLFYTNDNLILIATKDGSMGTNAAVRLDLKRLDDTADVVNSIVKLRHSALNSAFWYSAFVDGSKLIFPSYSPNIDASKFEARLNKIDVFTFENASVALGTNHFIAMYMFEPTMNGAYYSAAHPLSDEGGGVRTDDNPKLLNLQTFSIIDFTGLEAPAGYKRISNVSFVNPLRPQHSYVVSIYNNRTPAEYVKVFTDYKIIVNKVDVLAGAQQTVFETDLASKRFTLDLFTKPIAADQKTQFYYVADWNQDTSLGRVQFVPHNSVVMSFDWIKEKFAIDSQ